MQEAAAQIEEGRTAAQSKDDHSPAMVALGQLKTDRKLPVTQEFAGKNKSNFLLSLYMEPCFREKLEGNVLRKQLKGPSVPLTPVSLPLST